MSIKYGWNIEDYGDNKNLILVNGKSVATWQTETPNAIKRLFVYGTAIGFFLDDGTTLYIGGMPTTSGALLQSVTIKAGFTVVTPVSGDKAVDE